MDNSEKTIGSAALISITALIGIQELPKTIAGLNNGEWLAVLLGALSLGIYLLSNTYILSRQIAKSSVQK